MYIYIYLKKHTDTHTYIYIEVIRKIRIIIHVQMYACMCIHGDMRLCVGMLLEQAPALFFHRSFTMHEQILHEVDKKDKDKELKSYPLRSCKGAICAITSMECASFVLQTPKKTEVIEQAVKGLQMRTPLLKLKLPEDAGYYWLVFH